MTFKNFRLKIVFRSIILAIASCGSLYFFLEGNFIGAVFAFVVVVVAIFNLIHLTESTNRKLVFFLESIENTDFTVKFSRDNKYGKSFERLNQAFNRVLGAFREVRADKEAHLQYLHTVVQYVSIGLISFDHQGKIGLLNNAAIKLLNISYIRSIQELSKEHNQLLEILTTIQPGENKLLKHSINHREMQLSINATELRLRGTAFKLISLTNIKSELQRTEVEAWQNLARVLRHEIMNSITPIISHVETMNEMIQDPLSWTSDKKYLDPETTKDITSALETIENRSKGLLHFVDAYRNFSQIPTPTYQPILVKDLFERLIELHQGEIKKWGISTSVSVTPNTLKVSADLELIDTVLINLFKNAIQALQGQVDGTIMLYAGVEDQSHVFISIEDNGPGIIPEAMDKIFVPFFTTKEKGSGIGLSLSRQIMQMHQGNLTAASLSGRTVFTMYF